VLGIASHSRSVVSRTVRRQRQRRALFSTYYDSQSGLHIPIHNEKEITLIINKSEEPTSTSSFVPAHFYKEDASSDVPDKLQALQTQGIHGVILPPSKFPRDLRNLQTLSAIAPPNFTFFSSPVSKPPTPATTSSSSSSLSMVLEFAAGMKNDDDDDDDELYNAMKQHVSNGMSTTLAIRESVYSGSGLGAPINIASQIAKLIDRTGGGNFFWLSTSSSEAVDVEEMMELCEELMYLDVVGSTIKSRLVIESLNEEIIEETMMAGVNKYVIDDEEQVDVVEEIAKWQGKTILR
jgi:hypothetical protein